MKVMILAAGLGERMRPLTDHTPKPLLAAGGMPLIEHHLRHLAAAGLRDVVINVSHLAQQIIDYCGDGSRWNLAITYSREAAPLETAGGIQQALPLLGDDAFIVINGDVWSDFPIVQLAQAQLGAWETARLVMVGNPEQHPLGDFRLDDSGRLHQRAADEPGNTYAGIGLYSPRLFAQMAPGKLALRPLLDAAIAAGTLGGQYYAGRWLDVGTPQRLQQLDAALSADAGQDVFAAE